LRDLFLVASKILETKIWKELEMPALQLWLRPLWSDPWFLVLASLVGLFLVHTQIPEEAPPEEHVFQKIFHRAHRM
jgi:hypothetical protein